jgi:membrane protease subunit (stomatin/prohibitin family)
MAGSETLRLQSSLFGSTRNYKVAWGTNAPFSIHDNKKNSLPNQFFVGPE